MRLEGNGIWDSVHKAVGLLLGHRVQLKPPSSEPPKEFMDRMQTMSVEELSQVGVQQKPQIEASRRYIQATDWPDVIE